MRQFQRLDITTFESHEKILDALLPGGLFAAQKTKNQKDAIFHASFFIYIM